MSEPAYPPGWYPDPMQRFEFRFHNGTVWTADVSTNGVLTITCRARSCVTDIAR